MRGTGESGRIFGVGLSKTGTTSLTAALEELGIPTVHNPHDGGTRRELENGHYRLSILERFRAVTDIPVAPFYAQLDAEYPGSKFILTVREVESWLRSIRNHWELMPSWEADPFYRFLHAAVYGCLRFHEERFRFAYESHRRNVVAYFEGRPDDLLVLDIVGGEGWERLCPFLGVPVPEGAFPHRNTADDTARWAVRVGSAVREIESAVPGDNAFILVDEQEFGYIRIRGRAPIPFLERGGAYWGLPTDSETAVREVERLRGEGARAIVFAWPAFWWLQHYSELDRHLRSHYPLLAESEQVVIFDLARPRGSSAEPGAG